ncbi:putative dehydrogenase [Subtercola frigoramans]|uniref:Dehydrogenase n=2 Tax=Subtercola frigoramans TaxID=120298 RepID=A0ABS2L1U6_9MICO|nr:putative dehydrogenase [Subtercola frigoramans]
MIAELHRRAAVLSGAVVIGVLGSRPERSHEVAERWGVEHAFGDLVEVIAARPDVVHICTPNSFHFAYALELLDAGIHVVCEKPLGLTAAESMEMDAKAAACGLVATVPFVYRFHPMVREIRERRLAGELGEIALIHGSYLQDWMLAPNVGSWRVDPIAGGASRAFADIGSHWCDLVEWVSGERFSAVSSAVSILYPERPSESATAFTGGGSGELGVVTTEDIALAQFRTESGVLASVTVSQVSAGRKNRLWFELDGTRQSAVFDQENPESAWMGAQIQSSTIVRDPSVNRPEARRLSSLPAGHPQGYAHCFEAFVDDTYAAVRGDVRDGLPTFADGARAARIVEAVLGSARDAAWKVIA